MGYIGVYNPLTNLLLTSWDIQVRETNISHLWEKNIIFKNALRWDILVPRRISKGDVVHSGRLTFGSLKINHLFETPERKEKSASTKPSWIWVQNVNMLIFRNFKHLLQPIKNQPASSRKPYIIWNQGSIVSWYIAWKPKVPKCSKYKSGTSILAYIWLILMTYDNLWSMQVNITYMYRGGGRGGYTIQEERS